MIVTVGAFDGVHRGHSRIVEEMLTLADERSLSPAVITFDPIPKRYFSGGKLHCLTTLDEKKWLLERIGVRTVVALPFDGDLAVMSYRDFVEKILLGTYHTDALVVGYDHTFGRDREGGIEQLKRLADELGFVLRVVPELVDGGGDVKSSTIRNMVEMGNIKDAIALLGHPYILSGEVVPGERRGRRLGFPTANIAVPQEKLLPKSGVYFAQLISPFTEYGLLYVGDCPTYNDVGKKRVEIHLLMEKQDDLYGERFVVGIMRYMRSEQSFSSEKELVRQMELDKIEANKYIR